MFDCKQTADYITQSLHTHTPSGQFKPGFLQTSLSYVAKNKNQQCICVSLNSASLTAVPAEYEKTPEDTNMSRSENEPKN